MDSLKQLTFNNIAFNATAKIISVVCLGISSIILTRTLLPSDYGVVGFAMIFVNFLSQFNDLGFSSAVGQRKELDERGFPIMFRDLGYSESHQLHIDQAGMKSRYGLDINEMSIRLERSNLLTDSVGRLGTSEITRLGWMDSLVKA